MEWMDRYENLAPPGDDGTEAIETVEEAASTLITGNERFVRMRAGVAAAVGSADPHRLFRTSFVPESVAPSGRIDRQAPFSVIFGCADARFPAEIVFDTGPNRLFVVRVAGNVPGNECVGSIEYAAAMFRESLRMVTVVGHTGCGAVAAAVSSYLHPQGYAEIAFSRSLRSVVNHILVAVRSAALALDQAWGTEVARDPGYEKALAELACFLNAGITAYQLQSELGVAGPPVLFGVYDLATSRVGFPSETGGYVTKLSPAPSSPEQLVWLGHTLARSGSVGHHLARGRLTGPK